MCSQVFAKLEYSQSGCRAFVFRRWRLFKGRCSRLMRQAKVGTTHEQAVVVFCCRGYAVMF